MVRICTSLFAFTTLLGASATSQALQPQRGWLMEVSYLNSDLYLKTPIIFTDRYGQQSREHNDLPQVGTGFGYVFQNGLITELKFNTGSLELLRDIVGLDAYQLTEIHVATAYDFYFAARFSVGPELRLTKAKLQAEEGEFLNPGPEEKFSLEDYTWTWGAKAKWRISHSFTMTLSHYRARYDFGDSQTTGLEFQWHWN